MSTCTDFSEVSVLIPGYSVEDLPTDLPEEEASSLLNAIACAWHPRLIHRSAGIPLFRQAESLSGYPGRRVVLVPAPSESWMPHEWRSVLKDQGHLVIAGVTTRTEWLEAIDQALASDAGFGETCTDAASTGSSGESALVDPRVVAAPCPALLEHFCSLGITLLQTQVLSRRRHHFVDADSMLLEREVHLAAAASLAGDADTTAKHLKACFEHLREIRERFYPLNCFLIDLCIPGEQEAPATIQQLLTSSTNLNLFATSDDITRWISQDPSLGPVLNQAIISERLCLLTGHDTETRSSLGSMANTIADLQRCRTRLNDLIGTSPRHWARRRFGLTASLPALLNWFGFESTMHFALDDGLYPDREHSQFDWQGPDGSLIAAASRIPLAVDSASGFLRFADRYNESMQDDTTAALFLARLPILKTPWLQDLQIASRYAPVLGEFATVDKLRHVTEGSRRSECHQHSEYLAPFLIQSSVLKTEPPVSGPAILRLLSQRLESLRTLLGIAGMMKAGVDAIAARAELSEIEHQIAKQELAQLEVPAADSGGPTNPDIAIPQMTQRLDSAGDMLATAIQGRVPGRVAALRGLFVVNSVPFGRLVELAWPTEWKRPAASSVIELSQRNGAVERLLVKLPPGGFVWLTECESEQSAQPLYEVNRKELPLAESLTLRNRHFEVLLSERTGGIASVAWHGQRGNRLSQQACFRYEREQTLPEDESGEVQKTAYALTRLIDQRVVEAGSVFASVETVMELLSPVDRSLLGVVRQKTSVDRVQPRIHIHLTFEDLAVAVKGNPWLTYFGCRFAWDNEAAAITRAVMGQAGGFRSERFESPDYVEVSDPAHRLVVATHGRPYHRRSGPRMFDSLLIVEGETSRQFQFTIDFDQPFPLRTATDVMTPPVIRRTDGSVPVSLSSSWILGLSVRNVELVRCDYSPATTEQSDELILLLSETEGASVNCVVRTARRPTAAFAVNADRSQKVSLEITDQGVIVPLNAFQLKGVLLIL